jgi:hypothetical protein
MMRALSHPWLGPALWAVLPVIRLWSGNLDLTLPGDMGLPLALAGLTAAVLYGVLRAVMPDRAKASLLASAGIVVLLQNVSLRSASRDLAVTFVLLLVVVAAGFALRRTRRDVTPVLVWANLTAAILLVMALPAAGIQVAQRAQERPLVAPAGGLDLSRGGAGGLDRRPDIYYIVLDCLGRPDVLSRIYHCDLTPFTTALQRSGFHVLAEGRTNYSQTVHSLGSTLNMTYLPGGAGRSRGSYRRGLAESIRHSGVAAALAGAGYRTVVVNSGYSGTSGIKADEHVRPWWALREFTMSLLEETPLGDAGEVARRIPCLRNRVVDPRVMLHVGRIRYGLERIPQLARESEAPVFVFAHMLMPHPPFVMDRTGHITGKYAQVFSLADRKATARQREAYLAGYREQTLYIASQMERVVAAILANPGREAVIIIQGDHGPGFGLDSSSVERTDLEERLSIFNAIRVPPGYDFRPWPGMTPVNTFRLLFNTLFGTRLEHLEDRSFFATWTKPGDLVDVTSRLRQAPGR